MGVRRALPEAWRASMGPVRTRWLTAFLDTPGPSAARAREFWSAVTGFSVSDPSGVDSEFTTLQPADGDPYLRVQELADGSPGCHLDLHVDDVPVSLVKAETLGASIVSTRRAYVRMRSPGGFRFCLVPHHGQHRRPLARTWPDGHRSLVDQVCIDVPPDRLDDELTFWTAFTGWECHSGSRPEFHYLDRAPGMPLRVLFQRLDDEAAGAPARAHLDIAAESRDDEARLHADLGAELVRRTELWTTMRDPVGHEYCLTDRDVTTGRLEPASAQADAR